VVPAPATGQASNAAPDATWKPAGASALAALASEEMQSREAPAAQPVKAAARPAGVKSLVEQMNLADQGGIEPTGALPLSIKGVERTDESPIRRKSSVARGQEEIRQKRGTTKVVVGVLVAVVAVVAAGAFGVITYLGKQQQAAVAVAVPVAPPPAAPPAAPAAAAIPPPAAAPAAVAPPAAPPPPVAVAVAPEPPPEPAAPVAKAGAKAAKGARADPPPPPPARTAVARREEPAAEPPPPKAAPKKKGDGLLDGIDGGGDDALSEALGGGGGSGRSVYVPPKPGGSAALADTVTDGQVTEGIKGKFESLAECADKGSGSGATVVMQWDITAEGGTRGVKCKAPCGDPGVGTCLGAVIRNIRFPRSTGGRTKVEFPFKF